MPTARSLIAGLAVALTAVSCTQDKSPTAPDTGTNAQNPASAARPVKQPLNFATSQVLQSAAGATYTLTNIQVTHFARNPDASSQYKLLVSGVLTFTDA